jgi:hypothetical protein
MRALCGAIITAGALIGLGLTALGVGTRYQSYAERVPETGVLTWVRLSHLDTPLLVILIALLTTMLVGLAIAFFGLAYHHERRWWERTHPPGGEAERERVLTP